jgi:hypothetical protein
MCVFTGVSITGACVCPRSRGVTGRSRFVITLHLTVSLVNSEHKDFVVLVKFILCHLRDICWIHWIHILSFHVTVVEWILLLLIKGVLGNDIHLYVILMVMMIIFNMIWQYWHEHCSRSNNIMLHITWFDNHNMFLFPGSHELYLVHMISYSLSCQQDTYYVYMMWILWHKLCSSQTWIFFPCQWKVVSCVKNYHVHMMSHHVQQRNIGHQKNIPLLNMINFSCTHDNSPR